MGISGFSFRHEHGGHVAAGLALAAVALLATWTSAQGSPEVTAADLRAHVELLASDADAGRATGSPESAACARELAALFAEAGLQPAGDDGFLQPIDRIGFEFDGTPELAWIGADGTRTVGGWGGDFEYLGGPPWQGELDVVVARTGTDAPAPPRADAALMLVGSRRAAQKWLADGGAPGGAGWGALLSPSQSEHGPSRYGESRGLFRSVEEGAAREPLRLLVHGRLRDALLAGEVAHLEVGVRARSPTPALNVVGLLPGVGTADRPELAQEAVVITAHYDHLGARLDPVALPPGAQDDPAAVGADAASAEPDLIYNGADDDASGCAAVIELAQAFGAQAADGEPPARTLVFLLVTGEERGLLGTEWWLDHPAVPLARMVLNLNFEMIGRPDELAGGPGRLWLTGDERSNLGVAWRGAGLPIAPDARPGEHFFERSDNYAFVERGVVGQSLSSFNLHAEYHTVEDEIGTLDFAHMEGAVRAALEAARMVADGTIQPAWVEGHAPKAR